MSVKKKLVLALALFSSLGFAQTSQKALRESADVQMGPRALLLSGGDVDSRSGVYIIEFPEPNDCVVLGPIEAKSRSFALYRAISKGGFTLKPSDGGGLTVWTIEEWSQLTTEPWYAEFKARHEKRCNPATSTKDGG